MFLRIIASGFSVRVDNIVLGKKLETNLEFYKSMKDIAKIIETQYDYQYILKNGFLIRVNDEKQLLERLEKIVSDKQIQEKFSENSVKVRDYYSEESISRKWLELFEK